MDSSWKEFLCPNGRDPFLIISIVGTRMRTRIRHLMTRLIVCHAGRLFPPSENLNTLSYNFYFCPVIEKKRAGDSFPVEVKGLIYLPQW